VDIEESSRARCAFCGAPEVSGEHAFPLWVSRLFRERSGAPFTLNNTGGRSKRGLQRIPVVARSVCRSCNQGWMSEMEQRARPLLTPCILGESAIWGTSHQEKVATWAFKTALMLDRSSTEAHVAPPEHFDHLWLNRTPPKTVLVSVGRYVPLAGEDQFAVTSTADHGHPSIEGSYRLTFSIGQMIFMVHGRSGTDDRGLSVAMWGKHRSGLHVPLTNTFTRLWPSTSPAFQWPSPDGFTLNTEAVRGLGDPVAFWPDPIPLP
jgi:hypothetical protein